MFSLATAQRSLARALPPWWLFLITGIGWMLVALIVLRFDYTSVSAISILFGIVALAAGVLEIGVTVLADGWWKLLHGVLALVFILGVGGAAAATGGCGDSLSDDVNKPHIVTYTENGTVKVVTTGP